MAKVRIKSNTSLWDRARNMFFPGVRGSGPPDYNSGQIYSGIQNDPKNLNKWRGPVQVIRIKVDLSVLADAVAEAERPLPSLPYRVLMQTLFLKTIDNGYVFGCVQKRKDLTLLKDFHICDDNDKTDEEATKLLQTEWFHLMRNYIHDAIYYGYSLITFGDLVDGGFPNLQITRRTDVSPDRLNLASFQYIPTGINFMEEPHYDWSLWVPTPSENGISTCGYGLLYKSAPYDIIMRSLLGWNTDYTERYGMPTAIIKTVKDAEEERERAEEALKKLGSLGGLILDTTDEYELISGDQAGTGWKSYDNLEARCKKAISLMILGHEDAASSTPGKLGSSQGGKDQIDSTPIGKALAACESKDSRFEENIVNNILIPKLIKLGLKIPAGKRYKLKNDQEREQEKEKEVKFSKEWAEVAKTMADAGLKMDVKIFQEKTGIETTEVEKISPPKEMSPKFKEKLNKIYAKH